MLTQVTGLRNGRFSVSPNAREETVSTEWSKCARHAKGAFRTSLGLRFAQLIMKRKNIENMTYLCIQFVSLKFTPKLTCFFFFFSVLVKIPINLFIIFFPSIIKLFLSPLSDHNSMASDVVCGRP